MMRTKRDAQWLIECGGRLRRTREALDVGQADMAALFGSSAARWNNYENGRRPLDIALAMQLCVRYRLTLDWLYRGDASGLPHSLAVKLDTGSPGPPTARAA